MNQSQRSILATVLVLVIALCANFLITQCAGNIVRIDTTASKLFTLSEGSRKIIAGLQKPLELKLFYSKALVDRTGIDQWREINNLYYNVRDLLRSYERESAGKLTLVEYDPQGYSDAEGEAERLGIQRLQDMGSDGLYFGMAVESPTGKFHTVKVFDVRSQSQIEYQISEAIELTTQRAKTKVGVLSSLDPTGEDMSPMMRQQLMMQGRQVEGAWAIIDYLKQFFEIQRIPKDAKEIEAGIDYLLVIHPKSLPDETLFAIDQFVMRGGKSIFCVDPQALRVDQAPQDPQNPYAGFSYDASSEINKLLNAWGVNVPKDKFVGDPEYALDQPSRRGAPQRVLGFLKFQNGAGFAPDSAIAGGIRDPIAIYFGGAIEATASPVEGVAVEPILSTSTKGNTFTAEKFELAGGDFAKINERFEPGVSAIHVAARITGKLKSAFPEGLKKAEGEDGDKPDDGNPDAGAKDGDAKDGDAKDGESAKAEPAHLVECREPNTVIVFADVDFLADGLSFQRFGPGLLLPAGTGNGAVFHNAIDSLAGSTALMSIRKRGEIRRTFDVVDEIEQEADLKSQEQIKAINRDKERFQKELSELSSQATDANVGMLRNDALKKKRELEKQVREKERELIRAQREKTVEIEALGSWLQWLNVVGVPLLVLIVGAGITFLNMQRRNAASGGAL
ncbi:MAG: Gldg family protein [Planctomycetota bacterium]